MKGDGAAVLSESVDNIAFPADRCLDIIEPDPKSQGRRFLCENFFQWEWSYLLLNYYRMEANLYCWGSGESCWQYVDAEYFEVYAGRRHLREWREGAHASGDDAKFQKSYEVHVEISDRDTFVRKYICQEKRMRVSLPRWRYLPERLAGIILCVGAVEVALLDWLGYGQGLTWQRGTMALGSAAVVLGLALLLEVDSLWEQIHILLLDYVSNTLYPRQIHVYEAFEKETDAANSFAKGIKGQCGEKEKLADGQVNDEAQKTAQKNATAIPLTLKKEEEKIFQEVLSDFLG